MNIIDWRRAVFPSRTRKAVGAALLTAAGAACGDATGPRNGGSMTASIGGTTWAAALSSGGGLPVEAHLEPSGALSIMGIRLGFLDYTSTEITIVIPNFADAGAYRLADADSGSAFAQYRVIGCSSGCDTPNARLTSSAFSTTSSATGLVTISTFDRKRQTVSGSFQFDAQDEQGFRILAVRNGAFEMAWRTP